MILQQALSACFRLARLKYAVRLGVFNSFLSYNIFNLQRAYQGTRVFVSLYMCVCVCFCTFIYDNISVFIIMYVCVSRTTRKLLEYLLKFKFVIESSFQFISALLLCLFFLGRWTCTVFAGDGSEEDTYQESRHVFYSLIIICIFWSIYLFALFFPKSIIYCCFLSSDVALWNAWVLLHIRCDPPLYKHYYCCLYLKCMKSASRTWGKKGYTMDIHCLWLSNEKESCSTELTFPCVLHLNSRH